MLPDTSLPAVSPGFDPDEKAEEERRQIPKNVPSDSPAVGDVVQGKVDLSVKAWAPPCLMLRLGGGGVGRVCVTEIAEEPQWRTDPLKRCVSLLFSFREKLS